MSSFVNPLQFGVDEDFDRYPRSFDDDCALTQKAGASALWCPDEQEVYPYGCGDGWRLQAPAQFTAHLCGPWRPGHFDGVVTVVIRLLGLVRPHQLWLGEKDWQQLTILRHLVQDIGLAVRVRGCPTVREADGLAASSRNRYLSMRRESQLPPSVRHRSAADQLFSGTVGDALGRAALSQQLSKAGFEVEYVETVDPVSLQPAEAERSPKLLAASVRCGTTRLIDHVFLMTRSPIVAIDGPAGAGKSTVTRAFAERLGLLYLDTGAMYRAVTWWVQKNGADPSNAPAVEALIDGLRWIFTVEGWCADRSVNGRDITDAIRDPEVTGSVSLVAAHPCVRALLTQQ